MKDVILSKEVDKEDLDSYGMFCDEVLKLLEPHIVELPGSMVLGFDWENSFYWHQGCASSAVKSMLSEH